MMCEEGTCLYCIYIYQTAVWHYRYTFKQGAWSFILTRLQVLLTNWPQSLWNSLETADGWIEEYAVRTQFLSSSCFS